MLPLGDLSVVLTSPLVFRRNGLWHSALAVLAPSTIVTLHFRVISPSVSVVIVARLPPSVVPCGAQPLLSARPCHGYILALLPFCTCTFALLPCTFALLHPHVIKLRVFSHRFGLVSRNGYARLVVLVHDCRSCLSSRSSSTSANGFSCFGGFRIAKMPS